MNNVKILICGMGVVTTLLTTGCGTNSLCSYQNDETKTAELIFFSVDSKRDAIDITNGNYYHGEPNLDNYPYIEKLDNFRPVDLEGFTSGGASDIRIVIPETQVTIPETPVVVPDAPIVVPATPVAQPERPVAQPTELEVVGLN